MKNKNGFTLVELLAVISVLGVIIVLSIPTILDVLGKSKNKLDEYNRDSLIDAAKYYITDIDLGEKEFIYPDNTPTDINGKTYTKGMTMTKYDAKVYLIENNGLTITAYDLVKGGYYDKNCQYAGETVEYKEGTVVKTSVVSKDQNCHVPASCKIKVGIKGKKVQNDAYYITEDYTVELLDGCE